jgi:hypothetical protein
VAAVFGALAVLCHDRWRRSGWRAGAVVGPVCFALALLSAEGAVAMAGYLAAHALFLDPDRSVRRLRVLAPYAVVLAGWQLLYTALGYGVAAAEPGYLNPLREPALFLRSVVTNGPVLLLAQWTGPSAQSFGALAPTAAMWRWIGTVLVLGALALLAAARLRRDPVARFWGLGHVLAIVPACAASPDDRYLVFVGIGAMGLLGQLVAGLLEREGAVATPRRWRWPATVAVVALAALHLVVSPVQLVRAARVPGERAFEVASDSLPTDDAIRAQTAIVVNVPTAVFVSYAFFTRAFKGQPMPERTRVLASGAHPVAIERLDSATLLVRWEGPAERMFRAQADPMRAGDRVRLPGLDVEVTAVTPDGLPRAARFRFDRPLEDPRYRWLRWSSAPAPTRGFVAFRPPAVGQTVAVP